MRQDLLSSIIPPKQKNKWLLKPIVPALSLALLIYFFDMIKKYKVNLGSAPKLPMHHMPTKP
ncbi:hypothetical protein SPRA44_140197 [Serratia proteamaculans]|nr:hypothetical protein SPRA44_140197 [Serratia proteamaculans]